MGARWSGRVLVIFGASVLACLNPGGADTESETALCVPGAEGCECLPGGICEGGLVCASQLCTVGVDPTGTTSDSTTAETTGQPVGCDPRGGPESPLCAASDPSRPYCGPDGYCVDCTELASCGALRPICDSGSGYCVECLPGQTSACAGDTPACDPSSNTCAPCTQHDECPASACDKFTGACFPPSTLRWVDRNDPNCKPALGSEEEPFCNLDQAMTWVDGATGPAALRIRQGLYQGPVIAPPGRALALINADAGQSVLINGVHADGLVSAKDEAKLFIDGVALAGNSLGSGVVIAKSKLWLDRSELSGHADAGLHTTDSSVTIDRAVITSNGRVGVELAGGALYLTNTFVTHNGKVGRDGGVLGAAAAELRILFSTFINNEASAGYAASVECVGVVGWQLALRSSVFIGKGGDSVNCPTIATNSVVDGDYPDGDNLVVDTSMISSFFTAIEGIYRAKPETELATVGLWKAGDPALDFDGAPRPTTDGASDYPGADRP
jgi:hypothetical protein